MEINQFVRREMRGWRVLTERVISMYYLQRRDGLKEILHRTGFDVNHWALYFDLTYFFDSEFTVYVILYLKMIRYI